MARLVIMTILVFIRIGEKNISEKQNTLLSCYTCMQTYANDNNSHSGNGLVIRPTLH